MSDFFKDILKASLQTIGIIFKVYFICLAVFYLLELTEFIIKSNL